jgi:hypothetical protein
MDPPLVAKWGGYTSVFNIDITLHDWLIDWLIDWFVFNANFNNASATSWHHYITRLQL